MSAEYPIHNDIITYEVFSDGYDIYMNNRPWISIREPGIPYPDKSYAENAIAQINEYIAGIELLDKVIASEPMKETFDAIDSNFDSVNSQVSGINSHIAELEDALCDLSMLLPAEEEEQA